MRAHGDLTTWETQSQRAARLAAMEQVRRISERGSSESELLQAWAMLAALNAPQPRRPGVLALVVP